MLPQLALYSDKLSCTYELNPPSHSFLNKRLIIVTTISNSCSSLIQIIPWIFISDTVILESEWVLRYAYKFSRDEICDAFVKLFGVGNVHLSNPSFIAQAIKWYRDGLDFFGALHLTQCQQYEKLYTLDKKFAVKAKNLTNCSVELP